MIIPTSLSMIKPLPCSSKRSPNFREVLAFRRSRLPYPQTPPPRPSVKRPQRGGTLRGPSNEMHLRTGWTICQTYPYAQMERTSYKTSRGTSLARTRNGTPPDNCIRQNRPLHMIPQCPENLHKPLVLDWRQRLRGPHHYHGDRHLLHGRFRITMQSHPHHKVRCFLSLDSRRVQLPP